MERVFMTAESESLKGAKQIFSAEKGTIDLAW